MPERDGEKIDHLIAAHERMQPYHTPSVLLLIFMALLNYVIEIPALVWLVFIIYFGIDLAGSMAKQRRESDYV